MLSLWYYGSVNLTLVTTYTSDFLSDYCSILLTPVVKINAHRVVQLLFFTAHLLDCLNFVCKFCVKFCTCDVIMLCDIYCTLISLDNMRRRCYSGRSFTGAGSILFTV